MGQVRGTWGQLNEFPTAKAGKARATKQIPQYWIVTESTK